MSLPLTLIPTEPLSHKPLTSRKHKLPSQAGNTRKRSRSIDKSNVSDSLEISEDANTTPFVLYMFKKNGGTIETQLVVLYCSESSKDVSHPKWKVHGGRIPVSFGQSCENIAFAVGICTQNGVHLINDLNCVIALGELGIHDQVNLENNSNPGFNKMMIHLERKASNFLEVIDVRIQMDLSICSTKPVKEILNKKN